MRSVVITGVSRGLGAALFHELHAAGDRILALGRRFTESQYAAERAEPGRIRLRPTDLAYPASLPDAAELASFLPETGEVVLIHNAATLEPVGAIGALAPDQIANATAVNFTSVLVLTNAFMGTGIIRSTGPAAFGAARPITVLFLSSGAAQRVIGGWSVYAATKKAAENFFEALTAQHSGDPRVRITCVNPGVMDTQMQGVVRQYAQRGGYFPDGAYFLGLHERGELPPPAAVARQIIVEHLTGAGNRG